MYDWFMLTYKISLYRCNNKLQLAIYFFHDVDRIPCLLDLVFFSFCFFFRLLDVFGTGEVYSLFWCC